MRMKKHRVLHALHQKTPRASAVGLTFQHVSSHAAATRCRCPASSDLVKSSSSSLGSLPRCLASALVLLWDPRSSWPFPLSRPRKAMATMQWSLDTQAPHSRSLGESWRRGTNSATGEVLFGPQQFIDAASSLAQFFRSAGRSASLRPPCFKVLLAVQGFPFCLAGALCLCMWAQTPTAHGHCMPLPCVVLFALSLSAPHGCSPRTWPPAGRHANDRRRCRTGPNNSGHRLALRWLRARDIPDTGAQNRQEQQDPSKIFA